MSENSNGSVDHYRLEQVENAISNHEKNCEEYRKEVNKELNEIKTEQAVQGENIKHMSEKVDGMASDLSAIKDCVQSNTSDHRISKWMIGVMWSGGVLIVGLLIKMAFFA